MDSHARKLLYKSNYQIGDKLLLKEYITNDMIALKNYLNIDDEDKIKYLPHEYPQFIDDFFDEYNIKLDTPNNYRQYELVAWLENKYNNIFLQYGKYLFEKIKNYSLDIFDSEYPTWSFFSNPDLVKNQWLIHFTHDAESIAREGFTMGVDDINMLGLTTYLSDSSKKYGGYNFAYTINDFLKYNNASRNNLKYGEEVVLFTASGLRLFHYGDDEYQVIFYGSTAKNIIPIQEGEELAWGVYNSATSQLIQEFDELDKMVSWCIHNFPQYKNVLTY
ncbi:MAG: hypothetical protein ACOCVF_01480 [bacterium]